MAKKRATLRHEDTKKTVLMNGLISVCIEMSFFVMPDLIRHPEGFEKIPALAGMTANYELSV